MHSQAPKPAPPEEPGVKAYRDLLDNDASYFELVDGQILQREDEEYVWLLRSLLTIENFVSEVLASDAPAFIVTLSANGHPRLDERPLAQYFSKVEALSRLNTEGYVLSERVQLLSCT